MDIRSGRTIFGITRNNQYEVEERIGSGAFGIVFKIIDLESKEHYALKTINTDILNGDGLDALQNEAQQAVRISHPNVIKYIYFHDGNQYEQFPPYIIMELATEGTLRDLIEIQKEQSKYISNNQLNEIFLQLSMGMEAINNLLIHRDLRPANILISDGTIKISDFGLSKVAAESTRALTFKGIGHMCYKAPEAWEFEHNDCLMDIYSLGIIFYEVATLSLPYSVDRFSSEAWRDAHLFQSARPPNQLNENLPTYLNRLIVRMISKTKAGRPQSWGEIISILESEQKSEKEENPIIEGLVTKAIDLDHKREEQRLKMLQEQNIFQEKVKIVKHRSREFFDSIEHEIINRFNTHYQRNVLTCGVTEGNEWINLTVWSKKCRWNILISIKIPEEEIPFKYGGILAYGYCQTQLESAGFHLLLVKESEDDIYGAWKTVFITYNPIANPRERVKEPIVLSGQEFIHNVRMIDSVMGVYRLEYSDFKIEMLIPFIEEML